MNALVASVIRTYTPIIVGQVAAWLILIHIPVLPELTMLVTAIVGGGLSAVYYLLVRVLEQQWPGLGVLLGLTASPDTYSKGDPLGLEAPKQTSIAATAVDPTPVPAASFADTQAKIDALAVAPAEVVPVFTPPAA